MPEQTIARAEAVTACTKAEASSIAHSSEAEQLAASLLQETEGNADLRAQLVERDALVERHMHERLAAVNAAEDAHAQREEARSLADAAEAHAQEADALAQKEREAAAASAMSMRAALSAQASAEERAAELQSKLTIAEDDMEAQRRSDALARTELLREINLRSEEVQRCRDELDAQRRAQRTEAKLCREEFLLSVELLAQELVAAENQQMGPGGQQDAQPNRKATAADASAALTPETSSPPRA